MRRYGAMTKGSAAAGYVLLVLLLWISLMVIAAAVIAPSIAFTIKRDREEELVHRGTQYTRAIRRFSRKFGRYPANLDELQNTSGQRFLRKKYKDPVTGKDFKLLHFADVQLSGGPGVAALTQGSQPAPDRSTATASTSAAPTIPPTPVQATGDSGESDAAPSLPLASPGSTAAHVPSTELDSTPAAPGTPTGPLGGGSILGVASPSKLASIREFGHKNHYNDWKFYYDPGDDRGFAINGPTVRMVISSSGPAPGQSADLGQQQPVVQTPTGQAPGQQ